MIRRVRSRRPLEAGKFDYKYIGVNVGDIPLVGTGKPDHEVFELHLDEFHLQPLLAICTPDSQTT